MGHLSEVNKLFNLVFKRVLRNIICIAFKFWFLCCRYIAELDIERTCSGNIRMVLKLNRLKKSNSMPFVYSFGLPASLFVDASQKPSFCRNSINHSQTPTFYTYHQNEAYSFLYSLLMINANFYHAQKSICSIALPFASTE